MGNPWKIPCVVSHIDWEGHPITGQYVSPQLSHSRRSAQIHRVFAVCRPLSRARSGLTTAQSS